LEPKFRRWLHVVRVGSLGEAKCSSSAIFPVIGAVSSSHIHFPVGVERFLCLGDTSKNSCGCEKSRTALKKSTSRDPTPRIGNFTPDSNAAYVGWQTFSAVQGNVRYDLVTQVLQVWAIQNDSEWASDGGRTGLYSAHKCMIADRSAARMHKAR
jgi:hypothetical protein